MKTIRVFAVGLIVVVTIFGVGDLLKEALQMYQNDTLRDNPSVIEFLRTEAEQGTPNAAFLLATAYRNGKAGTVDLEKAFYWYQKSADLGDPDAMLMLGWLYYKQSNNIEANTKKAHYWFRLAASKGVEEAVEMLELLNQGNF
jgi:TPR repeat protein